MTSTERKIVKTLADTAKGLRMLNATATEGNMAEDFRLWISTRYIQAMSCLKKTCRIIRKERNNG